MKEKAKDKSAKSSAAKKRTNKDISKADKTLDGTTPTKPKRQTPKKGGGGLVSCVFNLPGQTSKTSSTP